MAIWRGVTVQKEVEFCPPGVFQLYMEWQRLRKVLIRQREAGLKQYHIRGSAVVI